MPPKHYKFYKTVYYTFYKTEYINHLLLCRNNKQWRCPSKEEHYTSHKNAYYTFYKTVYIDHLLLCVAINNSDVRSAYCLCIIY